VAGYVGTHGLAHHLETVLDAAEMLRATDDGDRFHFIFLGDGARKQALKEAAAQRGLSNVTFIDSVPKEEVARYWSLLNVSVIHLRKTELFTTVIPSKLFECMGMGLPVLHGVAGESADIVRNEGVGMVFEPENAEQLVTHLQTLQRDTLAYEGYRARCLEAAKKYDRTTMAMKLLEVLEKIES
jgi:glycosyltransferase involved in cell wall biosynthesis